MRPLDLELRGLLELRQPTPPVFADHPVDLAAIVLPPQPNAEDCFSVVDEGAVTPDNGAQVGVFGYPGAAKLPMGKDFMASPEHFFGPLDAAGSACSHDPQQDFTVPYDLSHPAKGYSGSGVWHFPTQPIWSPRPHLCGIVATHCAIDTVVSGFKIETIVRFLLDNEDLLRR